MRERLPNGYTQAYAQIMQHTHTLKAVTGPVEAKKLLSRRRQSNYTHVRRHLTAIMVYRLMYMALKAQNKEIKDICFN